MAKRPAMRGKRHITSVTLDPDQMEDIDRHAESQRSSRSAVIRQAVQLFLIVNPRPTTHTDERQAA